MPLTPADLTQITNLITTQLASTRIKISELPPAGAVGRSAVAPFVDAGSTVKVSLAQLLDFGLTSVPTGQDLRNTATDDLADGSMFVTLGVGAAGDGGGGAWVYDAASTATDNIGTVISPDTGVGRFLRLFTEGVMNIRWFGATIDGSDDTTAVSLAITAAGPGGSVYFPNGTGNIKISTKLTQLAYQRWFSNSGLRGGAIIEKAANIDMVDMGDYGEIQNIDFEGVGATYTGRGIYIPAGNSQKINRVRVTQTAGVSIQFAADAGGSGALVSEVQAETTSPLTVAAISAGPDTTAKPRFFRDIMLSGGYLDLSGAIDQFVDGLFCHHIKTSSTTSNAYVVNVRYASVGAAISIQGSNGNYSNVAFAGVVTFENSIGLTVSNVDFGFGFVEDSATCTFNAIDANASAYTPVWDQASGTQPAIGDGTLTGWYIREGRTCTVNIRFVAGAGTTFGNNAVAYRFSLPFRAHNAFTLRGSPANLVDATTYADATGWITVGANEQVFTIGYGGQAVRQLHPFTWAVGDEINITFKFVTH